jgi:hypothetical protein
MIEKVFAELSFLGSVPASADGGGGQRRMLELERNVVCVTMKKILPVYRTV